MQTGKIIFLFFLLFYIWTTSNANLLKEHSKLHIMNNAHSGSNQYFRFTVNVVITIIF